MQSLELRLLNSYQRDFPLVTHPFRLLAEDAFVTEAEVLDCLRRLRQSGAVSRVGPVFAPGRIGASTLLALAVPAERVAEVTRALNAIENINHSYEREHEFNIWVVAVASNERELDAVVGEIEARTGLAVLSLPMVEEYRIDLGFDLTSTRTVLPNRALNGPREALTAVERRLVHRLQSGLDLVSEPYRRLAEQTGTSERCVLAHLSEWIGSGVIRRFGVIVRHHELGYCANAMAVWDVPDALVSDLGRRLARVPGVTLAYRRTRSLPHWPYNLFCMVHGRQREWVKSTLNTAAREAGLERFPHAVLFSRRRFKQTGARYITRTEEPAHG